MNPISSSLGEALDVRIKASEVSESPIEAAMFLSLLSGRQHTETMLSLSGRGIVPGDYRTFFVAVDGLTALVVPQLKVSRYRLDLAVILERYGRRLYAVIECDGQEFHSHPDDVKRDKERDRNLAAAGWLVCRFPGSEVYTTPGEKVWAYLATLAGVWCKSDQELMAGLPAEVQ